MTESYSLRDHFAGLAMKAELITAGTCRDAAEDLVVAARRAARTAEQHIATNAYSMADAMLAQRDKGDSLAAESIALETENASLKDQIDGLRDHIEKLAAIAHKQSRELDEKDAEIERLLKALGCKPDTAKPKPHNPDGLTPEQVGVADGWRLLDKDEVILCGKVLGEIEIYDQGSTWSAFNAGSSAAYTYRTKLTRNQLRKARGLEGKEAR